MQERREPARGTPAKDGTGRWRGRWPAVPRTGRRKATKVFFLLLVAISAVSHHGNGCTSLGLFSLLQSREMRFADALRQINTTAI